MAGESYYFIFSIIAVIVVMLHIANALYFKFKGKTLVGEEIKSGALGYEKFRRFSSTRGLIVATIVAVLAVANLAYDVDRLIHMDDQEYARGMLVYAPIAIVLLFIAVLSSIRSKLKSNKRN